MHEAMSQLFDLAKTLHADGRLQEAAELYQRVPDTDPDRHRALNNLGLILDEEGRLEDAAEILDRAISARDDVAILHCNRARVLHQLGRFEDAIKGYRRAIELQPDWVDPYHNLAMALEASDQVEEAERSYQCTLELEPRNRPALRHLADILYDSGRPSEALPHYRLLVELDRDDPRAHFDLAKTLTALSSYESAAESYRCSLEIEPKSGPARQHYASVLRQLGRIDEARSVLEGWKSLAPDDPISRHLLAALTGDQVPQRAADNVVRGLFDEFADSFDETLARLDYHAPELVSAAVMACRSDGPPVEDILDAGCGTGLCGVLLRPQAKRLVGVDLSHGMLARAHERSVYDELFEDELTRFLLVRPNAFDIIASSDTFNYFGVLDELLRVAAKALRPGGHLVFTLEREQDADPHPWHLQSNGRYNHSEQYCRAAIDGTGLTLVSLNEGTLRKEATEPVQGWIVTARLDS